jgi:putative ABC transport system substrate-binding protein
LEELRRLGYEDGRNLTIERYSAEGQGPETYRPLARRIVATRPDVILGFGASMLGFVEAVAGEVPIITVWGSDPVAAGLSNSWSRPSKNVTGLIVALAPGFQSKRFDLIREIRPDVSHLAMLVPRYQWDREHSHRTPEEVRQAGLRRYTCLCAASPVNEAAHRQAFADLDHDRPDFIWVSDSSENTTSPFPELIVGLVNATRVPALYPTREFVQLGGLISYGWDRMETYRHMAHQMDMILRGRPVAEVPFYGAIKWELAVNLKTANALGLVVPPSILLRADLVIE